MRFAFYLNSCGTGVIQFAFFWQWASLQFGVFSVGGFGLNKTTIFGIDTLSWGFKIRKDLAQLDIIFPY